MVDVDLTGRRRVADGVPQYVLDRAPEQLQIAADETVARTDDDNTALPRLGLQTTALHDLANDIVQPQGLGSSCGRIAFRARHLDQRPHEFGEPIDFFLQTIGGTLAIGRGTRKFDRQSKAGQRGTQLVGNVLQQAPLCRQERLNAIGHAVERAGEMADLVAPADMDPGGEIAPAKFFDRTREVANRLDDGDGEEPTEQRDRGENEQVIRYEGPHVERRRRRNQ